MSDPKSQKNQDSASGKAPFDPLEFQQKCQDLWNEAQHIWSAKISEIQNAPNPEEIIDPFNLTELYGQFWNEAMKDPKKLAQAQIDFVSDQMALLQKTWQQMITEESLKPDALKDIIDGSFDKRFKGDEWENNAFFNYIKNSYLVFARHIMQSVHKIDTLDAQSKKRVDFFTKQFVDALSPSNFFITNPSVLKETIETKGENLMKGYRNFLRDFAEQKGVFQLSTVDKSAFKVGENLATTPGHVVYQNDLMQLIQYTPTTKDVFKTPLLITPPWINKYYILDLQQKNSFINWLINQGHTVFVISWVNPDEELSQKSFESYLDEGLLTAISQVQKQTGEDKVNCIGYCLGGTLLTCALAYIKAAKKKNPIQSATFLTTLIDFTDAGDMLVFIDEDQLSMAEKGMQEKGFFPGEKLKQIFSMMRANDLIWSFFVNNYLMGKSPMPFDLLYWNDDATRMPYKMHSFYLRQMYLHNNLVKKNAIEFLGQKLDISKIDTPAFFLSTKEDHIAPWKATYEGPRHFTGPVTYTLAESGHIAGVVNHPDNNKYGYWTGNRKDTAPLPETSEEWLQNTTHHDGSWWPYWQGWMNENKFIAEKTAARDETKGPLKPIEPAPGSYVLVRS